MRTRCSTALEHPSCCARRRQARFSADHSSPAVISGGASGQRPSSNCTMRALRGAARPCARASRTTSPHSASISAPAQRHVVGHARSRFLVDAQHARCHSGEQCVRQAQQRGKPARRHRRHARRLGARRAQHAQRLINQRRKAAPPVALHQLGAQRQARQRIHRVVQVEQQLAPLHGRQIGVQRQRQARAREQRQPRSRRHIVLRGQHPLRAAVQMAGRQFGHIEGHHARHHAQLRRRRLRARRVVHTVLQRQHRRAGRQHARQLRGRGLGAGALDGEQHQAGRSAFGRQFGRIQRIRRDVQRGAADVAQRQALRAQHIHHARPTDEVHARARPRQPATDPAADRAGTHDPHRFSVPFAHVHRSNPRLALARQATAAMLSIVMQRPAAP